MRVESHRLRNLDDFSVSLSDRFIKIERPVRRSRRRARETVVLLRRVPIMLWYPGD
jgi:hypothetical protein